MLKDEEIKKIINQTEFEMEQQMELVRRYIYDKKNVEVLINPLYEPVQFWLMDVAFQISLKYYMDKFKNEETNK